MADAKKCDRCGSYYEPYNLTGRAQLNAVDEMRLTPHDEDIVRRWELCPTCAAYLHAVLKIEPLNEIGGAAHEADD